MKKIIFALTLFAPLALLARSQVDPEKLLLNAAINGDIDAMHTFIVTDKVNIDTPGLHTTPLSAILALQADAECGNTTCDATANAIFAKRDAHLKIAGFLLKKGANPNRPTGIEQNTPLHYALLISDLRFTALLLRHHANVNTKNAHGKTPFEHLLETKKSHSNIFKIRQLLFQGGNPLGKRITLNWPISTNKLAMLN